jgi:hypothetical protein
MRVDMMLRKALLVAVLVGHAVCACAAERADFIDLARASYVHCAFYKNYDLDPLTGEPLLVEGKADVLMHLQGIDVKRAKARAIYTRMSGQREVTVIQTDKALHFIDSVEGMYVMTTVYSCIDYDEKRRACVAYAAVNSRVFDSLVLSDPDAVFEKIKDHAELGFCDHSIITTREAAQRAK